MGLLQTVSRWIRGSEPTIMDFDNYTPEGSPQDPWRAPTPEQRGTPADPGSYKMQQSYDALQGTVRELREALDGQARRQDELLTRLGTMPQAIEALPQTSKIQSDMLVLINNRLKMHAEQQKKVNEAIGNLGGAKNQLGDALEAIREQIETGNEIDRQLVDSFNRFSMMIDRLHMANMHAVECLQQVRDSYAASAMQMQEWIERSRQKHTWLVGGAFVMSLVALAAVFIMLWVLFR